MVQIESLIPGASFSSNVFTIPVSALNAKLANDISGSNSAEKLYYALLQLLLDEQEAGTLSQPQVAMEIGNKSHQRSVWEEQTNVFSSCNLTSFLVSFNMSTNPVESGNDITQLPL